jgi:putative FmdB family regulatory protein
MPTYAYRCPACGHEFEKFHKMSARTRPKCPVCGGVAQRVITGGAGLHFKGSGFYVTDYKKGPKVKEEQEGPKPVSGEKKTDEKKLPSKKSGDDH